MVMQVRRTATANNPPPAGSLAEGQLSLGLADDPPTIWVGVPTSIDPSGVRLASAYVPLSGGTMTGPLILSQDAVDPLGAVTLEQLVGQAVASGPTPPANPNVGDLWMNTSLTPPVLNTWNGGAWVAVAQSGFLPLTGGTLTGSLYIAGNPSTSIDYLWSPNVFCSSSGVNILQTPTGFLRQADAAVMYTTWTFPNPERIETWWGPQGAPGTAVTWTDQMIFFPGWGVSFDKNIGTGLGYSYQNNQSFGWIWTGFSTSLFIDGSPVGSYPTTDGSIGYMAISGGGGPVGINLNIFNGDRSVLYAWYADITSDARIKDNIEPTRLDALSAVLKVPVRQFDYKPDAMRALDPAQTEAHAPIGIVAQEAQPFMPEMVKVTRQPETRHASIPEDLMTLNQAAAVPYLIRAIQQLETRVRELEQGVRP